MPSPLSSSRIGRQVGGGGGAAAATAATRSAGASFLLYGERVSGCVILASQGRGESLLAALHPPQLPSAPPGAPPHHIHAPAHAAPQLRSPLTHQTSFSRTSSGEGTVGGTTTPRRRQHHRLVLALTTAALILPQVTVHPRFLRLRDGRQSRHDAAYMHTSRLGRARVLTRPS